VKITKKLSYSAHNQIWFAIFTQHINYYGKKLIYFQNNPQSLWALQTKYEDIAWEENSNWLGIISKKNSAKRIGLF